jgi:hypothetical protein
MAHELDGLMGITNYRGCLVSRMIGGGYLIFGKTVESPEEVDKLIKVAGEAIEKSLTTTVTNSNGAFQAQNTEGDTMYPSEGI